MVPMSIIVGPLGRVVILPRSSMGHHAIELFLGVLTLATSVVGAVVHELYPVASTFATFGSCFIIGHTIWQIWKGKRRGKPDQ